MANWIYKDKKSRQYFLHQTKPKFNKESGFMESPHKTVKSLSTIGHVIYDSDIILYKIPKMKLGELRKLKSKIKIELV